MSKLTYRERMTIQLLRKKKAGLQPSTQQAIAQKFGLSKMYVSSIIAEKQHGEKSDAWRKKFAAYAGMEN
ncbi:hypothetical protein CBF93_08615 [Limosilactobacillus reuteri]|uniref:sigma factor-like helix-turn-helix DNA-binding protein n=1 Tax=Limosilactobacillus reuteri TaxID=1598 RepID=UPI000B981100|nr:sigma factor-like helix-turn-helix DNA-binding protein [Limosilactobacillus reuteri]OYS57740.1 hypothetical protein CBF93_08615 [Limosilactobacillus reuteri]